MKKQLREVLKILFNKFHDYAQKDDHTMFHTVEQIIKLYSVYESLKEDESEASKEEEKESSEVLEPERVQ